MSIDLLLGALLVSAQALDRGLSRSRGSPPPAFLGVRQRRKPVFIGESVPVICTDNRRAVPIRISFPLVPLRVDEVISVHHVPHWRRRTFPPRNDKLRP